MSGYIGYKEPRKSTQEYVDYIYNLNPKLVAAHLYTWHMGDMSGGQMIKKVIAAPHRNLDFANADVLKETIRSKLDDSFADEANRAFAWAIKLMNEYEFSLG
jgi:heme oxygenase